jgi:hypothetical protein
MIIWDLLKNEEVAKIENYNYLMKPDQFANTGF